MVPRFLRFGLWLVFIVSLASLGAIVVFINPYRTGWVSYLLFSTAVFLALFSFLSWFGIWLRRKFIAERNLDRILKMAFRQGALVSLVLIAYLWLSHLKLLKFYVVIPVLILIVGVEYLSLRHSDANPSTTLGTGKRMTRE